MASGLVEAALARWRASPRLRRSLIAWLTVGLVSSAGYTVIVAHLSGAMITPLVAGDIAWWVFASTVFLMAIPMLVTPDGIAIDYLGLPNGLTAIRAWFSYPVLLSAALHFPHNEGFTLFVTVGGAVGMLDVVDGMVARRWGPITALGKAIDPAMDALYFSMGAVASLLLGVIAPWLMALILLRYLGPLVLTPVVFAFGKRPELVHTRWGRMSTALIGAVILASVVVHIYGGREDIASLLLGIPLLAPTTALHFAALIRRVNAAPRRPD